MPRLSSLQSFQMLLKKLKSLPILREGDISTDLLSPGNQAHSRSDRELHGQCMISAAAQAEIKDLQKQHPDKQVMLIAEKGGNGCWVFTYVGCE